MNRLIGVFTGNRAEYGLQYPVLKAIEAHPELDYRLIVSGAHLDSNFGETLQEIAKDGFTVHAEIKIDMDADSLASNVQAIGSGVIEIGKTLQKMNLDMMLVYADRFEGFAAVIAATQMGIPTGHIEGGDLTEGGALDDSVRHAMTKLSHLHFTTNEQASQRVLAMGEEAWRVHTVGFPAIDMIKADNYANREEILEKLPLSLDKPVVLFTQHSVTTQFDLASSQVTPSIDAIKELARQGVQVIVTYPNNDAGGRQIIEQLQLLDQQKLENVLVRRSLGRYLYHGILALALNREIKVACVGNSSSGIKETPVFGCPTVNIGSRQAGRLRGKNVIDADYDSEEIFATVDKCLNDPQFREICFNTDNPYYLGDAGIKIARVLADTEINEELIRKKMTLKGESREGWFR